MGRIQLAIRGMDGDWSGQVSEETCDRVIASLSADPESIVELTIALSQFEEVDSSGLLKLVLGLDLQPRGSGVVLIDLLGRLIAFESKRWEPEVEGSVSYHNGRFATDVDLDYVIDYDWAIQDSIDDWLEISRRRRLARGAHPPIDYREALYGDELFKFIAEEVYRSSRIGDRLEDYASIEAMISELHERWLLQPREEWLGDSARDVIMKKFEFINLDLTNRCSNWSVLEHPPEPLPTTSTAYRYAGWGNHEFIMYYDMVRHLMMSCWKWIALEDAILDEDGSSELVARLRGESVRWLHEPIEDFHGRSPMEIIENERRRLPEAVSEEEAIADCDCPLCVMMAEMPGVSFWHLDGSHLEPGFAFSMDADEEFDFESEQSTIGFREAVEKALELKSSQLEQAKVINLKGIGYQSYPSTDEIAEPAPKTILFFGIGCRLGELITELKKPVEQRGLIDALVHEWSLLREPPSGDGSCLDARIDTFHTTLDAVLDANPNLEGLVVWLHQALDRLENRQTIPVAAH